LLKKSLEVVDEVKNKLREGENSANRLQEEIEKF